MAMRLDRWLCKAHRVTRSEAKKLIRSGRVLVDGVAVRDCAIAIEPDQRVLLDDSILELPGAVYIALHKPAGYVCSHIDDGHQSALALLPENIRNHPQKIIFAGRLDQDTTGLCFLTTDGAWSHRVTSPRRNCSKVYRVKLQEPLSREQRQQLESGVMLHNEKRPCAPAEVNELSEQEIQLTISEGRYHQVKRMLAAVGNRVLSLHRESIGIVSLDLLKPGQWRALSKHEIDSFG